MKEVIQTFLSFGVQGYITFFTVLLSSILSIFITVILWKAMKHQDYSRLVINDQTGFLSQHKFWSNIVFLVSTIAFIKLNFYTENESTYLTEIWVIYLTVIGGVDLFSSWMKYKIAKKGGSSRDDYGSYRPTNDCEEDDNHYYQREYPPFNYGNNNSVEEEFIDYSNYKPKSSARKNH